MNDLRSIAALVADGMTDDAYDLLVREVRGGLDDPGALAMLRDSLEKKRKFEAALIPARRVLEVASRDGAQWDRLASLYLNLDRFEEARAAIAKSIELTPENPAHWHQAGLLAYRTGRLEEALEMFDEAAKLDPYGVPLRHDRAHAILAIGRDLPSALEEYEIRWESLYHLSPWDLRVPEWKGQDLSGKRVLMHSEQGYGDSIMSLRFARDLVARGAIEVGLCVPKGLTRLVDSQSWNGVRSVDFDDLNARDWDYQTPMFSTLRWLRYQVDDIDPRPYLEAPPISVPELPKAKKLVGICWASGVRNIDTGLRRHAPLSSLMTLGEVTGVVLVSLQKDSPTEEIRRGGYEAFLEEPLTACEDFAATAAVIDRLDAVVTVDTAVLHLAGALGKPTFMLNQYTRCWRWWRLPSGLPWYETVTSAQQAAPHDWSRPIAAAKAWIKAL